MIVFTANAIAKPTVQRFRLRSPSEPPPSEPCPVPTPKAPDRPASLPECMSTSRIRPTDRPIWMTEKSSSMRSRGYPVELAQDRDGLGARAAVLGEVVLVGQLARAPIELGVADLAVLGVLGGLERVAPDG